MKTKGPKAIPRQSSRACTIGNQGNETTNVHISKLEPQENNKTFEVLPVSPILIARPSRLFMRTTTSKTQRWGPSKEYCGGGVRCPRAFGSRWVLLGLWGAPTVAFASEAASLFTVLSPSIVANSISSGPTAPSDFEMESTHNLAKSKIESIPRRPQK
jgi:hypothetical protein